MKRIIGIVTVVSLMTLSVFADYYSYHQDIDGFRWNYTGLQEYDGDYELATIGHPNDWLSAINNAVKPCGEIIIPKTFYYESVYGSRKSRTTQIGVKAFMGYTTMSSVAIPDAVNLIMNMAFAGCTSLTAVDFGNNVQKLNIGYAAFQDCTSLSKIVLPESTAVINGRAFENCKSLTSFKIPSSVTSLGANIFSGCDALQTITVDESKFKVYDGVLYSNDMSTVVSCLRDKAHMQLPEGVRTVHSCAFQESQKIESLVLPESLTNIEIGAFVSCKSLKSITIRHNVRSIGGWAFDTCTNMTDVVVDEGDGDRIFGMLRQTGSGNGDWSKCTFIEIPRVKTPVCSEKGGVYASTAQSIDFTTETDGASIFYTLDGSEPTAINGRRYNGPFNVYQSVTVKAIAIKEGYRSSEIVTLTFTKENGLSEALNCLNILPDNDASAPWAVDTSVSHDGVSSVKSGSIAANGMTGMQISVKKAGRLSFWWRAECEEPDPEDGPDGYYDYAALMIDGTDVAYLAGEDTGWQQFVTNITTSGRHVIRWEYRKDGATTTPPDCVWVDQVQWFSASATDETDHTLTTETPVPYTWLDKYGLGRLTDFESAAKAKSGKYDGAGHAMTIEDEYIAGTDPTNSTSRFYAKIEMADGHPWVRWAPDLNEDGTKTLRTYKIWGKESLDAATDWEYPTNALHRFFKVTVEMP